MRLKVFLLLGGAAPSLQAPPILATLARDVRNVEAVRQIKDVTATYAQLGQVGRWGDMAQLFSPGGVLRWDDTVVTGREAVQRWLAGDAGNMDGIHPGSLSTLVMANPLVNLAPNGTSAQARFNGWWFQGDGTGGSRLQGGLYENEYALSGGKWEISLLRYYPMYNGTYETGWHNPGGKPLGNVPFHFTSDQAGTPIPSAVGLALNTSKTVTELARRIDLLNDEDEVRNLQHAYGYYVDRRMWTDVVDLFLRNGSTLSIDNVGNFSGQAAIRRGLQKWMGPEGLTQGVLNDRLLFNTLVNVHQDPSKDGKLLALTRGLEIGIIGNANKTAGSWQFNTFRNQVVKEDGIWKLKNVHISTVLAANYSSGWAHGSNLPKPTRYPSFLNISRDYIPAHAETSTPADTDLAELERRLSRSAAYDGVENVSNAYGFYIDFIDGVGCTNMANIHARNGHKESPFAGFYRTRDRVLRACTRAYGTNATNNRQGISYHWRPQPVIIVSQDGRSATIRARLLQPSTDRTKDGLLRGAIYHDQMNLEDGIWRLWSVTIDEFYWTSQTWKGGWPAVPPRAANATDPGDRDLVKDYPPDLLLKDMGAPRETGFQGGVGRFTTWPEIQRMWFAYRNPVTGRVPDSYWPGCVPCHHRPLWNLTSNGYQEPPTGPTVVRAEAAEGTNGTQVIAVTISAGPGEMATGVLRLEGASVMPISVGLTAEDENQFAFALQPRNGTSPRSITIKYLGSESLKPGQVSLSIK